MSEKVILVDDQDNQIGIMEKMEAHEKALRHRAFSVMVFNKYGEMMLQQRALSKYYSGGLWTNTCCSHPRVGETVLEAAHRRLGEEMGFDCELRELYSFNYEIKLDHGLTEKEHDHVFVGDFDGEPKINRDEVESWCWMKLDDLKKDLAEKPEKYTFWFKEIMKEYFRRT
jgi:isopentenyl-diphosphate Delta-isomerase